ncbi:MAG: hypothetical protein U5S82_12625 [Gammaproteobacteria bacterium]|nr:hypothetical protein [Gammaproteobacteria bacterium]
MSEQTVNSDALMKRIEHLEKRYRVMKLAGVLLVVVLLGYWTVRNFVDTPVTVKKILLESQEVKLVDQEGNTRFFLRLYSKVPILQLIDSNGKPRMSLGLRFDDTPFIDLSDKNGETRAVFEMTAEDEPTLRLLDRNGQTSFKIN